MSMKTMLIAIYIIGYIIDTCYIREIYRGSNGDKLLDWACGLLMAPFWPVSVPFRSFHHIFIKGLSK